MMQKEEYEDFELPFTDEDLQQLQMALGEEEEEEEEEEEKEEEQYQPQRLQLQLQFHQQQLLQQQQGKQNEPKKETEPCMSTEQWTRVIENSLNWHSLPEFVVKKDVHFGFERKLNRYTVKTSLLKHLKLMFPWFHARGVHFRQTESKRSTISIDVVIYAINSFTQMSSTFGEGDIEFLYNYFRNMAIPRGCHCLTAILEVYEAFQRYREDLHESVTSNDEGESNSDHENDIQRLDSPPFRRYSSQEIAELHDRIDSLTRELREIRNQLHLVHNEPCGGKRVRVGGDRAHWLRIRDAEYDTREEWCVPGKAMGLYSDGVGRLIPFHRRPRQAVVVYSVSPDTVEPLPNPSNADQYVRVVLIGEAPVQLRPDQYRKLKEWKCYCQIYVNHYGDVVLRKQERNNRQQRPPSGGQIFAYTHWSDNSPVDSEGFPVFQGVRGVCAVIVDFPTSVYRPSRIKRDYFRTKRFIRGLMVPSQPKTELFNLMARRKQLYANLANLDQANDLSTSPVEGAEGQGQGEVPTQSQSQEAIVLSTNQNESRVPFNKETYKQDRDRLIYEIKRLSLELKK